MVDPINSALETAHQKLSQLLAERSKIDKEIVDWKRVIDSLLAVSENDGSDPSDVELQDFVASELGTKALKFTDGVRMILRQNASRVTLSVPEIRDQLINLGFNFAKYAQPLVPIHNTLKRLEEQGEVSPIKNEHGQTLGYKWISPIERAISDENNYAEVIGVGILSAQADADHPLRQLAKKPDVFHPIHHMKQRKTLGQRVREHALADAITKAQQKK